MGEVNTKSVDQAGLARMMDDMLLNSSFNPQTPTQFFQSLAVRASKESAVWDEHAIMDHWSLLQRIGVVVLTGMQSAGVQRCAPGTKPVAGFYVTSRGHALLQRGEASPHNPARFCGKIRDRVASPDDAVMTYLDEGIAAWAAGLNRAAVVLLGCACERLILLLARALSETNTPPWSERLSKYLKASDESPVPISTIFQKVREALLALAGDKKLPAGLADAIDRKLTPIFEHTRALRNVAGHPTGGEVSGDDAEATLLLFPGFYFLTHEVVKALEGLSK